MEYTTESEAGSLEKLYKRMGEPSWLILRALQRAGRGTRQVITGEVKALQWAGGAPDQALDPSTLHYALQRMVSDGILAEAGSADTGLSVAEPTAVYHAGRAAPPEFMLTALGLELLERRQTMIAAELRMDTPIIKRPKPTIFGIGVTEETDLGRRSAEERPEPREWRSS